MPYTPTNHKIDNLNNNIKDPLELCLVQLLRFPCHIGSAHFQDADQEHQFAKHAGHIDLDAHLLDKHKTYLTTKKKCHACEAVAESFYVANSTLIPPLGGASAGEAFIFYCLGPNPAAAKNVEHFLNVPRIVGE